ncbi:dnaJ homolog subfamily C member 17 [Diachasma alloeum]|uniref:dnaJ homolog subfamily C member 17 n=1 Tax=Diachasma alloeum TaxID=454923 RepID=UPI000738142F|nr:dnaJ homolog subfamily C member 17 [Diachasma alloeum]
MEDLMHLDLYGLLDIEPTSTTSQIKTAYRKKALSCHPDKNPDNPRAGELFHQLSQVLEILTDESARQAYDKVLLAKAQAKERSKKLDAKRKKFKDDLEAREERFKNGRTSSGKSEEQKLKEEIERLEKMGSKLVEEEVNLINDQIRQQLRKDRTGGPTDEGLTGKVKIRWRADKDDVDNGGYSQEVLIRIMSKYGDVSGVVMSGKKGRALVEFTERSAGEMAVMVERGLAGNPLGLEGLWEGGRKLKEKEGPFFNDQIRQQLRRDRTGGPYGTGGPDAEGLTGKVKIRWRADKDDVDNGGYSQEVLNSIMSKYGDVSGVVMSGKKGRALVEFTERSAAEMAVMVERGLAGNPLKLEGLWEGEGRTNKTEGLTKTEGPNSRVFPSSGERFGQGRTPTTFPSFSSAPDIFAGGTDQNFESIVLGNLRRAEERKKLIQEMMEEDEKS